MRALVLSFGLLIIVFILLLPLVTFAWKAEKVENTLLTRDMYVMGNALEYGGIVADTALAYSLEQGCFDVLGNGGYAVIPAELEQNGLALWYDNGDKEPGGIVGELEVGVEKRMNEYAGIDYQYLGDLKVMLPSYTVAIEPQEGFILETTAVPDGMLRVERKNTMRGESITLRKRSIPERNFTACLKIMLASRGMGNTVGTVVEQAILTEANKWAKSGTLEKVPDRQEFSSQAGNTVMGDLVFQDRYGISTSVAETQLAGDVESALNDSLALIPRPEPFRIRTDVLEITASIEPLCTAVKNRDKTVNISCTFNDSIAALVKVTVSGGKELLATDGKTVKRSPQTLVFGAAVNRSFDDVVAPLDVSGSYRLDITVQQPAFPLQHSMHALGLSQSGYDVRAVVDRSGSLPGTLVGSTLILNSVPMVIQGNPANVNFVGTVGETITGHIDGVVVIEGAQEQLHGTFIATPEM